MTGKRRHAPTFSEIVAEVPEPSAASHTFSNAIPHPWITVDGERWQLRGDDYFEGKDLHRILLRSDGLVFHEYMGKRTVLPPSERESFWQRALTLMADSEYSAFHGYEYKHPHHGMCLVVYEYC